MRSQDRAYLTISVSFLFFVFVLFFPSSSAEVNKSHYITSFTALLLSFLSFKPSVLLLIRLPGQFFTWLLVILGIYLMLAPLLLWAPALKDYLIDTSFGILFILSALVIGSDDCNHPAESYTPKGWSYNPSNYRARVPTLFCAFICSHIARYMAFYQLGYLDHMSDPFFTGGTLKVITSELSKSFPISDAGFGSFVYTLEFLLALFGGPNRWQSKPYLVLVFGAMVVPAGLVSVFLIISQPTLVGSWCGWCLITAAFMLLMIAFSFDEVMATVELLWHKRNEKSFWHLFFHGTTQIHPQSCRLQAYQRTSHWPRVPFRFVISSFVGTSFMLAADSFALSSLEANLNHILGALIATFSIISFCELARALRYLNLLLGVVLIALAFILSEKMVFAQFTFSLACGSLLIALHAKRGKIYYRYGSLDNLIH